MEDYNLVTSPSLAVSLNTGHFGTYWAPSGGKFGSASSAWWKWMLKGDTEAGKIFLEPNSTLITEGWNLTSKNWDKYSD